MAEAPEMSDLGPSGAMDLPEEVEEQSIAEKKEEFLKAVEKLHQVETLDPKTEDLVNRIKAFQQLNGEQLCLEEVLRKKQEALKRFLLQCKEEESEIQWKQLDEENRKTKEFLKIVSKQHQQLQQKRRRLMAEMENSDMQFVSETHAAPEEAVITGEAQCVQQSFQETPLGPQEIKSDPAPEQNTCLSKGEGK
ncbi:synaptonemal complex central element protein 1-like isoform X1 [Tamandua tetradactyla]|uniref:synaptonemal complex central element protein 1-like isoform X1 n=1 Tax=Tamandua tetradactyla TaxID=48850 RepID=UPI004054703B